MKPKTPEERLELARLTREMVDLVNRCLSNRATRADLVAWARAKDRSRDFRTVAADGLYTCLWNAEVVLARTRELLVRDTDLVEHVRATLQGESPLDRDPIATLQTGIDRFEARVGVRATRYPIDGWGWREGLQFASLATGRVFCAIALHEVGEPVVGCEVRTIGFPDTPDARAAVLADLYETLHVSIDDLTET